jgi:hypothetical protein
MNKHFYNSCENISATVGSGDALCDPEVRKEFKSYLDSWYRCYEEFAEIFSEEDNLINKWLDEEGYDMSPAATEALTDAIISRKPERRLEVLKQIQEDRPIAHVLLVEMLNDKETKMAIEKAVI